MDPLLHLHDDAGNPVAFAHDGFGLDLASVDYSFFVEGKQVVAVPSGTHALLPEERLVADSAPQCVQGEGPTLVDAVVEHVLGAGVGEHQVLRKPGQSTVMVPGVLAARAASGGVRPQPLAVAGEPLVQPDVLPARERDGVAEPLVGELVRDDEVEVFRGHVPQRPLRVTEQFRRRDQEMLWPCTVAKRKSGDGKVSLEK